MDNDSLVHLEFEGFFCLFCFVLYWVFLCGHLFSIYYSTMIHGRQRLGVKVHNSEKKFNK